MIIPRHLQIRMFEWPEQFQKLSLMFYRGLCPLRAVLDVADLPAGSNGDYCYVVNTGFTYRYQEVDPGVYDWSQYSTGYTSYNYYPLMTNGRSYKLLNGDMAHFADCDLTLNIFGDDGLYANFFEKWVYWILTIRRLEKRRINFSQEQLSTLKWDNKYRILDQNYFINRIPMRIDFGRQLITYAEIGIISRFKSPQMHFQFHLSISSPKICE